MLKASRLIQQAFRSHSGPKRAMATDALLTRRTTLAFSDSGPESNVWGFIAPQRLETTQPVSFGGGESVLLQAITDHPLASLNLALGRDSPHKFGWSYR